MKTLGLFFGLFLLGSTQSAMAQSSIRTYIHPERGTLVTCRDDPQTGICVTISERPRNDGRNYRADRSKQRYCNNNCDTVQSQWHPKKKHYLERYDDTLAGTSVYRERRSRVRQRVEYGKSDGYFRRGLWFRHTIIIDDENIVIETNDQDFRPRVYRSNSGYYFYD